MILKFIRGHRTVRLIQISCRNLNSKIPTTPIPTSLENEQVPVKVDRNTISLLERLSLVSYDTEEGVKILEDSIAFANKVLHVNTDNVEPLYSVLEQENLSLREDRITQGNCQKDILKNAVVKEDDYFVAPIGNIPLHEVEVDEETNKIESNKVSYIMREPSLLIMKNVHKEWLEHIRSKTHKMVPVYLNPCASNLHHKYSPHVFGVINENVLYYYDTTVTEMNFKDCKPIHRSELKLHIYVPESDAMRYFIQWQRHRKYWWSTISTTPNLFSTNEDRYENKTAKVDIVAKLKGGPKTVESIKLTQEKTKIGGKRNCLTCTLSLEEALFVLLLDGINFDFDPCSKVPEYYLRLNRKIAPYKIAFALNAKDTSLYKDILAKIATYLHAKLVCSCVPAWIPNLYQPYNDQLEENLRLGVVYTAVLDEDTPKHGMLKLLHSNTMLAEQFHVADFTKYVPLLFE